MEDIKQCIVSMFIETDNNNWEKVKECIADTLVLDYSSMNSNPPALLTPQQLIDSWKSVLPGFQSTHHQIGNFVVYHNSTTAEVFCYGTATHYLESERGNLWTVVGSYNFELIKIDEKWKISKMVFNYKYQDGNLDLVNKAINNVKIN